MGKISRGRKAVKKNESSVSFPQTAEIIEFPLATYQAIGDAAGGKPWTLPVPLEPVRAQLAAFVETMFKHASAGSYVSLRAFRGDTGKPTSITAVKLSPAISTP